MRIGVVGHDPASSEGGAYTFISSLIEAAKSAKSPHTFLFPELAPSPRVRRRPSSRIHAGGPIIARSFADLAMGRLGRRRFTHKVLPPVELFIRDSEIDVVWFLTPFGTPVSTPYVATVWDLQHRLQPIFPEVSITGWDWDARELTYRSLLPRATRVVTGSHFGKAQIIQFYGVAPENIVVAPMPIADAELVADRDDDVDIRTKYSIHRDFLFYPSQFWPHKNHINLLLALDILRREQDLTLDLVLTGADKGNLSHVTDAVARLQLTSQVHFPGFVSRGEIRAFYRATVCLVYPSFFGPDNIPPLEAFAHYCPVIAANVGGAEEQLGDAAIFFDPRDPNDIARTIMTIYQKKELREDLAHRGREIVDTRTAQSYVSKMSDLFDTLAPYRRNWGHGYIHS